MTARVERASRTPVPAGSTVPSPTPPPAPAPMAAASVTVEQMIKDGALPPLPTHEIWEDGHFVTHRRALQSQLERLRPTVSEEPLVEKARAATECWTLAATQNREGKYTEQEQACASLAAAIGRWPPRRALYQEAEKAVELAETSFLSLHGHLSIDPGKIHPHHASNTQLQPKLKIETERNCEYLKQTSSAWLHIKQLIGNVIEFSGKERLALSCSEIAKLWKGSERKMGEASIKAAEAAAIHAQIGISSYMIQQPLFQATKATWPPVAIQKDAITLTIELWEAAAAIEEASRHVTRLETELQQIDQAITDNARNVALWGSGCAPQFKTLFIKAMRGCESATHQALVDYHSRVISLLGFLASRQVQQLQTIMVEALLEVARASNARAIATFCEVWPKEISRPAVQQAFLTEHDRTSFHTFFEAGLLQRQVWGLLPSADDEGKTPLMLAAHHGHPATVEKLLRSGADKDAVDCRGNSALMLAIEGGQADVVTTLVYADANKEIRNRAGDTALILAARRGHVGMLQDLLDNGAARECRNKSGMTALLTAVERGHTKAVQTLVIMRADKEARDREGATALILAARKGFTDIARILIHMKAERNAYDLEGCTPLMLAAQNNHGEIVEMLVKAGVDIEMKNSRSETARMLATTEAILAMLTAGTAAT